MWRTGRQEDESVLLILGSNSRADMEQQTFPKVKLWTSSVIDCSGLQGECCGFRKQWVFTLYTLSSSHFTSFSVVFRYTIFQPPPHVFLFLQFVTFSYGSKGHIDGFSMISLLCQMLLTMGNGAGMMGGPDNCFINQLSGDTWAVEIFSVQI